MHYPLSPEVANVKTVVPRVSPLSPKGRGEKNACRSPKRVPAPLTPLRPATTISYLSPLPAGLPPTPPPAAGCASEHYPHGAIFLTEPFPRENVPSATTRTAAPGTRAIPGGSHGCYPAL